MVHGENNIPKKIIHSTILLVEGDDDEKFFTYFLKYEKINTDDIHFISTKGSFNKEFVNLLVKRPNFKRIVKVLVVIRDAETNIQSTFEGIVEKFDDTFLTLPNKPNSSTNFVPKVGVYLIGNGIDIRMLEDLCLKTVKNNPEMKCVNTFCKCVSELKDNKPKNPSKAKAQAFLASKPIYAAHIGLGAKEGYWNFDSTELDEIRDFIKIFR
jgi:hypothetical protein